MQTATPKKPKNGRLSPQRVLSSRQGTMMAALVTAVLAAAILVVFLGRYRETTAADGGVESVLVAKTLIEKGTSGEVIATEDLFTVKKVNDDQVEEGAISDPSSLQGKVTSADVLPKQQLTAGALTGSTNAVSARLADYDRAITVGVDTPHGLLGNVRTGDKVDVIGVLGPVVRMLVRDVLAARHGHAGRGDRLHPGPRAGLAGPASTHSGEAVGDLGPLAEAPAEASAALPARRPGRH
jgi:Flp pilus assembly protein CpaB